MTVFDGVRAQGVPDEEKNAEVQPLQSDVLSGRTLVGMSSDISCDILSGSLSDILCDISSDIYLTDLLTSFLAFYVTYLV